jgi:hypothetical protein
MQRREFHSPILKRTVKPDESDYLIHYEAALIFELNFLNQQNCSCFGCQTKRKKIESDLKEIFNQKNDQNFQRD